MGVNSGRFLSCTLQAGFLYGSKKGRWTQGFMPWYCLDMSSSVIDLYLQLLTIT